MYYNTNMAEGNSGRRIGQGGLSGPLGARERKGLYANDVRPDRSGYPQGFAPDAPTVVSDSPNASEESTVDRSAPNSTDLDIGLLLATDPERAMEILATRSGRKRAKKDTA